MNNYLIISIGQGGNQINYELAKLKYSNEQLIRSFLVDSEVKVIDKFLKDEALGKHFYEGINVIRNVNGRGNNWALGYNIEYTELSRENNLALEAFGKILKYVEKCEFVNGFIFIHSLNGGTGSGVTTRLIEMLREIFEKFTFIDCPIAGLDSKI
jgi:hypothetical protein